MLELRPITEQGRRQLYDMVNGPADMYESIPWGAGVSIHDDDRCVGYMAFLVVKGMTPSIVGHGLPGERDKFVEAGPLCMEWACGCYSVFRCFAVTAASKDLYMMVGGSSFREVDPKETGGYCYELTFEKEFAIEYMKTWTQRVEEFKANGQWPL